ncbi:DUF481 domain-containing protein [Niveibacterium sp. SC-1]|uniref:DUF481 domain-containing protein n=1 Tax=Niveibacterium sp. SC-1 TaxID=3135646 RepID=UPI00311D735B
MKKAICTEDKTPPRRSFRALSRRAIKPCMAVACLCGVGYAAADTLPIPDGRWRGTLSGGLSVTAGNTRSTSINVGADFTRRTDSDKLHAVGTGLYATQRDNNTGNTNETSNLARAGAQYDFDLSPKIFGFGSLGLEHDELQRLELRSVLAGGAGWHAWRRGNEFFDLSSGISYNREQYEPQTRDTLELLFAEESGLQVSPTTTFKQRLAVFPNLQETGEYRIVFDSTLATAITKRISLQLTLSDRYQSNPPPGVKKQNDLLFLTNISWAIGGN